MNITFEIPGIKDELAIKCLTTHGRQLAKTHSFAGQA
jgi:hypothetical protein